MPLISREFTLQKASDLVAPQINIPDTLTQQLTDLDPTKAFAPDVLNNFRNVLFSEVERYLSLELDIFEDFIDLVPDVTLLTNNELSAALYTFGFNPADFTDISAEQINIDFVDRVFNSVTSYRNVLNGGPDFFVDNLRTIENITTKSLADLDIRSAVDSFAGPVTSEINSIISKANASVRQISNEVLNIAEAEANEILDAVVDLPLINESVIRQAKEEARNLFNDLIGDQIGEIQAGLPSRIAFLPTLTTKLNQEIQPQAVAQVKNITATAQTFSENLSTPLAITQDAEVHVTARTKDVEGHVTDEENARVSVISSAIAAEFMDNNPEADIRELENVINTQIMQANTNRKLILDRAMEDTQRIARLFDPTIEDLKTAGNDILTDSVLAGRPVANVEEVMAQAPIALSDSDTFDKTYFYPSNYRTNNAKHVNSLIPDVRARFAAAILEFVNTYHEDEYDISVTSSFRSYNKQAELYRKWINDPSNNTRAAEPGNSWHNYGCAMDIGIWYKGVYKRRQTNANLYTQLAAPIFAKYNLHNPHANDEFHFQPTELALNARQIKDTLIVNQKVDFKRVSSLLA